MGDDEARSTVGCDVCYVGEHIDDGPGWILDEEAPYSPWLVAEWVDDTQPALERCCVRRIDGVGGAEVDPELRLGVFKSGGRDEDLGGAVGR